MGQTTYISETVWRSIDKDVRRAILSVLPYSRSEIVSCGKFIANIVSELNARGERELAARLMDECPEPVFEPL